MRKSVLLLLSFLISFSAAAAQAHSPKQGKTAPAHVPEQIRTAKRVFISNMGGGCYYSSILTPETANRAYGEFYDAIRRWGQYKVVVRPSDAELNFEFGIPCPAAGDAPEVRLVIRDMKTRAVLWVVTERVGDFTRFGYVDKHWESALRALVTDLKGLADAGSRNSCCPPNIRLGRRGSRLPPGIRFPMSTRTR